MKQKLIIETPIFTKLIDGLLTLEEFRELQKSLNNDPEQGDLIQGTGGARKMRFALSGKGKSGGIRIIYYYKVDDMIFLLLAYPKNKQDNLTEQQKKILKQLIKEF
jgi:hypothetical protein